MICGGVDHGLAFRNQSGLVNPSFFLMIMRKRSKSFVASQLYGTGIPFLEFHMSEATDSMGVEVC